MKKRMVALPDKVIEIIQGELRGKMGDNASSASSTRGFASSIY